MLFDYFVLELDSILNEKDEGVSDRVFAVRNFIGLFFVFILYTVRTCISVLFAILYFLIFIFAFVGSVFRLRGNPYAFHDFLENKNNPL